jgi:hypothetical protein
MMTDSVDGMPASAQKQLFENLQRMKQNLVAVEPKTLAAAQDLGRTNRDAGRKQARIQRAR